MGWIIGGLLILGLGWVCVQLFAVIALLFAGAGAIVGERWGWKVGTLAGAVVGTGLYWGVLYLVADRDLSLFSHWLRPPFKSVGDFLGELTAFIAVGVLPGAIPGAWLTYTFCDYDSH